MIVRSLAAFLRRRDGAAHFTCTECGARVAKAANDGAGFALCAPCRNRWIGDQPFLPNDMLDWLRAVSRDARSTRR